MPAITSSTIGQPVYRIQLAIPQDKLGDGAESAFAARTGTPIWIPRPIIGAVFLVICGMIATVGLRLIACGTRDEAWLLTTAITLIAALTLPPAVTAQTEWYGALPPLAKLFLGNSVVIAITLGILLNAVFRAALPPPQVIND
mgnify:CR=1 FL=1